MSYEEFKNKYNGQYTDYDGYYGCQCWDLAQRYFVECLGLPEWVLSGCGNVCNMLYGDKRNDLNTFFDEVSVYEMTQGDVCIWESNHIAIFDNWDGNVNWYFSQNPNPSQIMQIDMAGLHAFRLRQDKPAPKPEPVSQDKFVNLPSYIDTWRFYDLNETPVKANANGMLKPSKFGGLSYKIYRFRDDGNTVEIETVQFGRVKIWVKDTPAEITQGYYQYQEGNH